MINAELLGRVLKHIKEVVKRWSQAYWSLATDNGTAHCFGAWAVTLSGITIHRDPIGEWAYVRAEDVPEGIEATNCTFREDRVTVISVATSLLGLSDDQAATLFDAENSLEDLERIVNELITLAVEELTEEIGMTLDEGLGDLPQEETIEKSLPQESEELVEENVPF